MFKKYQKFVEIQTEHEIKAFWWMNGNDSISKDFEVFLMEHYIDITPQDIGSIEHAK